MADVTQYSFNQQEQAGRKRFKTGIEFEKIIANLSRTVQSRMLNFLPSNYSKDTNTNLAELYRAISEEFSRLQTSISDINEDQYHSGTRAEYLYEILGDTLFLDNKAINYNVSDVAYRNFLIVVRNAYYGGSRKDNIEGAISDIIGIPVNIKEVYLELRKNNSSYTIKDTHKMFFDIMMDYVSTSSLGLLLENLKFFLDLIKPAHTLYDTRLIWTDEFISMDGKCNPEYVEKEMSGIIYGVDKIDLITYVISKLYLFDDTDPRERWVAGTISYTDEDKGLIYLDDNKILVATTQSKLYRRTVDIYGEITDELISFAILVPGDEIRYYADVDSSSTSTVITSDWLYEGVVSYIDTINETITLTSGKIIVYNEDALVYTRDKNGEYRIFISDILTGYTIKFRGTEYTKAFDFYRVPPEVEENEYKQFDTDIIKKPIFQDYVKKVPETWNNLPLGPQVVIKDGVATVIDIESRFYKRFNSKNYKSFKDYRYNLFIDDVFQKQFTVEEPEVELTEAEAKEVFIEVYGYTGINDSNYRIDIDTTAHLKETEDDPTVQAIGDQTEACDRRADCHLMPHYEDMRKYYEYPDIQLTSGFINTIELDIPINPPDQFNLPAYFNISSDPNSYQMPLLPLLNEAGNPASPEDLIVYINGLKVDNAVQSVDPWTGEVILNFLPPANSIIRIDYYYSKRYPNPQYYIEEIGEVQSSQRLNWPFPVTGSLSGGPEDFQVNYYPILDQQGNLATPGDIQYRTGDLGATGLIVDKIDLGDSDILVADSGITGINPGDTIIIKAENILDNTIIYPIIGITGSNEIVTNKKFYLDITPLGFPFEIIKFTGAPGAIDHVRPLLGHIHVTGPLTTGSYVKFDYYYTNLNRTYAMIPDVYGETGPYMNRGYTADTFYGNRSGYTLIPDRGFTGSDSPVFYYNQVAKKGYRYRAFNLSNSSVLNSRDTLILNGYYRNQGNASWKNNGNRLNQYDLLFSPEYLTDVDKNIVLNDRYLQKDLDPVTKLYPGTPLFLQTYNDDGHYKGNVIPVGENTYQEPSELSQDLEAGFTIVGTDTSGLIDYQSVCGYTQNKRIRLYSGLKIVERDYEGFQGSLSVISEGQRTIPFKTLFIEQYYPNREQRLNDYLDYINRVPEEIKTGSIKVLKNSVVVKKVEGDWLQLKIGDMFNIKDVPVPEAGNRDVVYTVIKIIDFETAELSSTFKYNSGEYDYELIRDTVYKVDVYLNEVNRILILNGENDFNYGLPESLVSHLPGYGVTTTEILTYNNTIPATIQRSSGSFIEDGWVIGLNFKISDTVFNNKTVEIKLISALEITLSTTCVLTQEGSILSTLTPVPFELYFPDPDKDPYPRSPDNPNITGLPTGDRATLITHETGLGPTDSDRIPLIREIIGADGNSVTYGLTGDLYGYTGPSGAIDLGLTGPTGDNNPRILDGDDKYLIPSGDTGVFLSLSESEYRVNWRNWDQDMIIISFGPLTGPNAGVILEEPVHMMNDLGEGITRYYWNATEEELQTQHYFGSIIETSELIDSGLGTTMMGIYPPGLILLDQEEAYSMTQPDMGSTNWEVKKIIIRELLQDNSIRVTEINGFVLIL